MSLLQQRPEGILSVRWVQADRIAVEQNELVHSFLLMPDRLDPWPPLTFDAIDDAALQPIIALAPQVVLLGSGARQRFLPARLQALLMQHGIGIESMDNAAAARTYNLLAQEGRRVLAAFVLPAE